MKTQFHVGDRCLVTGVQDSLKEAVGQIGTVVSTFVDMTTVQFDERFSDRLHSGNIGDQSRRCWNFRNSKIEPAPISVPAEAVTSLL